MRKSSYLQTIWLVLLSCLLLLLASCGKTFVPDKQMSEAIDSLSHDRAVSDLSKIIKIPNSYTAFSNTIMNKLYNGELEWNTDTRSEVLAVDKGFEYSNAFKYGDVVDTKTIYHESYKTVETIYEKLPYQPEIINYERIQKIVRMGSTDSRQCPDGYEYMLLKLSYPFNLSVCTNDILTFYTSMLKLVPDVAISEL